MLFVLFGEVEMVFEFGDGEFDCGFVIGFGVFYGELVFDYVRMIFEVVFFELLVYCV